MESPSATSIVATWILFGVIGVIIATDLYLSQQSPQATISYLLLRMAQKYPVLPLAVGLLLGHLLWPQTHTVIVLPDDVRRKLVESYRP